jgi:hypothetical protein
VAIYVAAAVADLVDADRRRHPAIYGQPPSPGQWGVPQTDLLYWELQETARSNTIRREQLYTHLRDQLKSLGKLQRGWDSYGADPPNAQARRDAEMSLEALRFLNAEPVAVVPSVDGGIAICFNNGERYAQLEFLNDGESHALLYGGPGRPQAWEVDLARPVAIQDAWTRISAYL